MRNVAEALADPSDLTEIRTIAHETIAMAKSFGLNALMAAAPLEGIDLERQREFGRDATP